MAQQQIDIIGRGGERLRIPADKLPEALSLGATVAGPTQDPASGPVPLDAPDEFRMLSPDGNEISVPSFRARAAADAGFSFLNPADEEELRKQAEFGEGIGSAVTAIGSGLLEGGLFPGADRALIALPGITEESLREVKKRRTGLTGGAQALGFGLGLAVPGGLGKSALTSGFKVFGKTAPAALTQASRLATSAGITQMASSGVGKGLESLIGRTLTEGALKKSAKFAIPIAQQLTEGAVIGAHQVATEASLGDPDLTAEQVLSNIGTAAVMNAAFGGAFLATRKGISGIGKVIGKKHDPVKIDEMLDAMADELAFAGGAKTAKGDKATRATIGRFLRENKIVTGVRDTTEQIKKRASDFANGLNDRLKATNNAFDTLFDDDFAQNQGLFVTRESIEKALTESAARLKIRRQPRSVIRRFIKEMKQDFPEGPLNFEKVTGLRKKLQEDVGLVLNKARVDRRKLTSNEVALLEAAESINKLVDEKADKILKLMPATGTELKGKGYRELRRELSEAIDVSTTVGNVTEKSAVDEMFSLGSQLGGAAAAATSGSFTTGVGAQVGLGLAKAAMKEKGALAALSATNILRDLHAMASAANKTQRKITKAVDGFMSPSATLRLSAVKLSSPLLADNLTMEKKSESVARMSDVLTKSLSDPEAYFESVNEQFSGMDEVAPNIANAGRMTVIRATSYLANTIPKQTENPLQRTFDKRQWHPTGGEVDSFLRRLRAVNDPSSIVDDLENGTVSSEAIETMKAVYPVMYAEIQNEIVEKAASMDKALPYQKRLALSQMFGVPIESAVEPERLIALQAVFETPQPEDPQGDPDERRSRKGSGFRPSRANRLKIGSQSETQSQRIEAK
jgi:hypothetical protein